MKTKTLTCLLATCVAVSVISLEASDWSVAPAEAEKPLNSPNPGFSIASFTVRAGVDGLAFARAEFSVVSANAPCAALLNMVKCPQTCPKGMCD